MQRSHQRHLQFAQQGKYVASCATAVNAILMLQTNKIVAVKVEKISGTLIGGKILLLYLKANLFWILIARIRIVDGDGKQSFLSVFGRERRAQIGCERGNAALSRLVVSHKRNAGWQRQFARI